jgi:hypothetical protein
MDPDTYCLTFWGRATAALLCIPLPPGSPNPTLLRSRIPAPRPAMPRSGVKMAVSITRGGKCGD